MRLSGALVLVTGASGGIGAAVVHSLARVGARPLLSGRNARRLERLAAELDAEWVVADLADADGPRALAEAAGPIDALINCAGVGSLCRLAMEPAAGIECIVRTNLTAPILLTRELLPGMLARGRGHLAFVGSIAGLTGVPREVTYSAAKAGLLTFADALRLELHGTGISVSTLSPGAVDTPFWTHRGAPYDRSVPRLMSAESVADILVRDIQRARARRVTPGWLAVAPAVRAAAPRTYERLAGRFA
ncbi:MAG TPA: SDR family NAD(P)-dependent oxidoreductase [Jatrophihabitans sp.]|nr:SDR family NAD(P)-dependent oxidoreductase [Jatrophihabitans sp.]